MNAIRHVLSVLWSTLAVSSQGDPRALDQMLPRANADVLLGIWVSTGDDAERLEFRRGGVLLVDGAEARYRAGGNQLSIQGAEGSCSGVWQVVEPRLWITLRMEDGTSRTAAYRREAARPGPGVKGLRPPVRDPGTERATAGAASFALPSGWGIAKTDARSALLDLGLRPPDTLDALVIVTSGEVPEEVRDLPIVELLRSHLQEIATELVDLQVEIDARTAGVRAVRLPDGSGAELTVRGTSGGQYPVTVWVGATRNETRYAAVIAAVVTGQEGRFLPGARSVLRTLVISGVPAGGSRPERQGTERGDTSLTGEFGYSTAGSTSRTITYTFHGNGNVTVHKMFSSPVGCHDSTAHGTFIRRGGSVTMHIQDEVVEATAEGSGAGIQALHIGATRYLRTR